MPIWNKSKKAEPQLPSYEELFTRFFEPWYDEQTREFRTYGGINPDVVTNPRPGISASKASILTPESQQVEEDALEGTIAAAHQDWPEAFKVSEPLSLAWLDAFDRYCDRRMISKIIGMSDPSDFSNLYLVYCCELGAVISEVFRSLKPDLQWLYSRPYWESSIFHPPSVTQVNVFQWAIKRMSEDGVEDRLSAKVQTTLAYLRERSTR